MNVVKISDGLGNQMFQYAFARKMQLDTRRDVWLDVRFINNEDAVVRKEENHYQMRRNDFRQYGLDKFQIQLPIADEHVLKYWWYLLEDGFFQNRIYAMAKKGLWFWKYCDEDFSKISMGSFLPMYYKGYFFNLKYYDDIKKILQREFVLKDKIHLPFELKEILKNNNTVSLHVRRGDFLRLNRDISQKGYYSKALDIMSQKTGLLTILVFSDDIEWVKNNIKIEQKVIYVSDMGFHDYEELAIMKHCRHNIIANSTFSYWAAYLNANPNKIVICPKHWKTEIIPKEWISL